MVRGVEPRASLSGVQGCWDAGVQGCRGAGWRGDSLLYGFEKNASPHLNFIINTFRGCLHCREQNYSLYNFYGHFGSTSSLRDPWRGVWGEAGALEGREEGGTWEVKGGREMKGGEGSVPKLKTNMCVRWWGRKVSIHILTFLLHLRQKRTYIHLFTILIFPY